MAARESPTRTPAASATVTAYSSTLTAPVHGAAHRPISARAHADVRVRGVMRVRHCLRGTASWSAALASSALPREPKGPAKARSSAPMDRTTDRRGKDSSVSFSHQTRSG